MLATVLLPLLALGIHLVGFGRCHSLLARSIRRSPRTGSGPRAVARGRRIAMALRRAADRASLLPTDCLPRALALWWLCRRTGLPADFRLGVRTTTGRFEAHAWVEIAGEAIGEDEAVGRVYDTFDLGVRTEGAVRS